MGRDDVVEVSTSPQLASALKAAKAGQTIKMADGRYAGNFVLSGSGTKSAPISLTGSTKAIIDDASGTGYTVHLDGANYWNLVGFSVVGGGKAIMTDESNNNVLSGLDVGGTGQEAIHLRNTSSNNVIEDCNIHDTGGDKPEYGEGVYIGTAKSNLKSSKSRTGGKPDASNGNKVINNKISGTTAESIDIKEGTFGGLIEGNEFDGSAISGKNFADSLMDVKGDGYTITRNTVVGDAGKMLDLFQTHVILKGTGQDNVFSANKLDGVRVSGFGINVTKGTNPVACDNTATGASAGMSNIKCTNVGRSPFG